MRQHFARIVAACREAGKRAATHAGTTDYAARMADAGFDLVTMWVDAVAIASSLAVAAEVWARHARPSSDRSRT
jgi:2-keto-3-deoxy-L-rhamnonate aldolase RhmA